MGVLKFLSIAGVLLFLYSYLLYPICLALWAAVAQLKRDLAYVLRKQNRRIQALSHEWPEVAVVIAAYNEQKHIAQRVRNLLELDYPVDRLKIYIGSDGSRDQTAHILQSFSDPRLQACVFEQNRGKASVLNDLVARGREGIVVFSDANTFFAPDALKRLVEPFQDECVGGVSGELRLTGGANHSNQDGVYWKVEQVLKFFESRIGGLLGANGAIYAIRRKFWIPLAADTICDDFCVAMNVAAQGGRLLYVPNAWAEEEMPETIDDEYHRRIRIGIGNFQALLRQPEYVLKTSWGTKFSYVSHKVLRWLAPHLLVCALVASLAVAVSEGGMWSLWSAVQAVGLGTAALAYVLHRAGVGGPSVFKLLAFLFALNWAFLVASWRYVSGQYSGSWRRTGR